MHFYKNLHQERITKMQVNFVLIGKRVRETRKQQKLTQDQLAEMSDLTVGYISHVETARKKASGAPQLNFLKEEPEVRRNSTATS